MSEEITITSKDEGTKTVDSRGYRTVEGMDDADINGDGHISDSELKMHLEFKRK